MPSSGSGNSRGRSSIGAQRHPRDASGIIFSSAQSTCTSRQRYNNDRCKSARTSARTNNPGTHRHTNTTTHGSRPRTTSSSSRINGGTGVPDVQQGVYGRRDGRESVVTHQLTLCRRRTACAEAAAAAPPAITTRARSMPTMPKAAEPHDSGQPRKPRERMLGRSRTGCREGRPGVRSHSAQQQQR